MMIKDLEISKELSRKDLAGVRGGFNFGVQGGQTVTQASVLNVGSPVTAVNTPTLNQNYTEVGINSAVIANSLAAVFQS